MERDNAKKKKMKKRLPSRGLTMLIATVNVKEAVSRSNEK